MKREISLAPSFFDSRSFDVTWPVKEKAAEKPAPSQADVFERVVWSLVWLLAILIVATSILGGAAIVEGLGQSTATPAHQIRTIP